MRDKILLKKISKERRSLNKLLNLNWGDPCLLAVRVLYNWLFPLQNKNPLGKSSSEVLFTAKVLQEAMYLTFPTWTESLTKFNLKMQDFKRVLNLN